MALLANTWSVTESPPSMSAGCSTGQRVYCDAWSHDYVWLSVMYDAVGLVPSFALGDIRELLSECEKSQWHEVRSLVELRLALKRHRASGDARTLFETLLEARQLCAGELIV